MPQKVLNFTGINRKVNEFHHQGACEELINIRPLVGGGFMLVKPKMTIMSSFNYKLFYEHTFGNYNNQIAVKGDGTIDWINPNDDSLDSITLLKVSSSNVSISHANNIIVIYSYDDNTQTAFKFKDGEYTKYYAAPVNMYAWMDYRNKSTATPVFRTSAGYAEPLSTTTLETSSWSEALDKAMSRYQTDHNRGLCGASIVGCTYELEDGNEVWSSAFVVADSSKVRENNTGDRLDYTPPLERPDKLNVVTVKGTEDATYCFSYDGKLEGIKKINIYASRPVSQYKIVHKGGAVAAEKVSLDETQLDSRLMYYQGSVDLDGGSSFALDFSPEKFAGDTMPVTAGAIERLGPSVSLNNRFHFYHSNVKHIIQSPTISEQAQVLDSFTQWIAYVQFENGWRAVDHVYSFSDTEAQDFIYPMSGVKQMVFIKCSPDDSKPLYTDVFFVEMKSSSRYNYSYAFDVTPQLERYYDGFFDEIYEQNPDLNSSTLDLEQEVNVINVTNQLNPYAFDITASYSFAGEIIKVVTSYVPISAVQINQFPITVFTTSGIYALEQGTGEVLYNRTDPLQPMVAEGNPLSIPDGVFFVSSNKLYLLVGREAVEISHPLTAKVDKSLRSIEAFQRLCNIDGRRIADALSIVDFQSYINGASLMYDQFNNEVIISNPDDKFHYSYVFNLDTKSFHKITKKYTGSLNSAHYAIEQTGTSFNLVNMYTEEESSSVDILLQSRPLSLELVVFTHVQRLLMLVDATVTSEQNLCLSMFGSDNLDDWKCIISAQKRGITLRQIRTNKAPKSYRDYVILITGNVGTDTDISDIIADYTIVSRRLG